MFKMMPEYVDYLESFKRFGVRPFEKEIIIRKKLGDNISILLRQDIEYSILKLSPKRYIPYIYSWGKFVGYQVAQQALRTLKVSLTTKIISKIYFMKLLESEIFQEGFRKVWIKNKTAIPSFTYFDEKAKVFRIKAEECDEVYGFPNIGKRICFYTSGLIAGNIESVLEKTVNTIETKCIADGHEFCEFLSEIDSKFPEKFELLKKSDFVKIRRNILKRMTLHKVSRKILSDFCHLAQFQVLYLGIWLSSPGSHTMLYWVGKETGKGIKIKFKEGKSIDSKLKNLKKIFKDMKIGILEVNKKNKKLNFIVKECAFSAGSKNIGKRICSYTAGLISGFLSTKKRKYNIVETKCIANGDKHCEFQVI
ncbi:MAG: V4R domain-containing protein [Candidatus Aenigmatarchaeota archaeon]